VSVHRAARGTPWQPGTDAKRVELIDFLRGTAIVEMIAAHFASYLPRPIGTAITYTETAMALFVLLAGLMVGWGFPRFVKSPADQTAALLKRALRVLAVQYIIILTLGIPLFFLGMPGVGSNQSLAEFLFQSMAFMNQIGLIHILPTFIPLFAVSPMVLLALWRAPAALVLLVSFGGFCVGHFHPHLLDLGQPTIFPFILFQFYFVVGCILGKWAENRGSPFPQHADRWLLVSCVLLATMMMLVHGKILPARLISTHPLNLFGLLYHAPIILTLCLLIMVAWPQIQRIFGFTVVTRFGRHALLAFVIHVYLAKAIAVANFLTTVPGMVNYALIVSSVVLMNSVLVRYESARLQPVTPRWARVLRTLFR
jgi:hypothetical protein